MKTEKWIDKEGIEVFPVYCEECQMLIGVIDREDFEQKTWAIWCDTCRWAEIKEEDSG